MNHTIFFRVKERIQETNDAIVYFLEPLLKETFRYEAGQFLTFLFRHTGNELRRSYSICTSPRVDPLPAIVVKRVSNGEISRYLHDTWKVGDIVEALPPAGRFMLDNPQGKIRDLFLLAAGSGISPLFGILKDALTNEPESQIHLLYSNQNKENTIFFDEINALIAENSDKLNVEYFFSESKYLDRARLHRTLLERLVQQQMRYNKSDASFFLCGPHEYMQMAEIVLISMGIDKSNIRKEIFLIEKPAAPRFVLADKEPKTVHIQFKNDLYSLTVPSTKSILDVAIEHHIPLPYNCQAGKCSACLAKCTEGKVVMSYNEVLTERDEAKGYVLTCTGHPTTDNVMLEY